MSIVQDAYFSMLKTVPLNLLPGKWLFYESDFNMDFIMLEN